MKTRRRILVALRALFPTSYFLFLLKNDATLFRLPQSFMEHQRRRCVRESS